MIFNRLTLAAGFIAGAVLASGPSYYLGKREGRSEAATEALAATVEVMQEREMIDDQISASDAAGLCGHLGLSDHDRLECVRKLEKAVAQP